MNKYYRLEVKGHFSGDFKENDPVSYIEGMLRGVVIVENALHGDEWNSLVDTAKFRDEDVPKKLLNSLEKAKDNCRKSLDEGVDI